MIMNQTTMPSKKSKYEVYIDNDICTLKVFRNNKILFYEINEAGEAKLMGTNLNYLLEEEPQWNYIDYLSLAAIEKIEILSQNYDIEKIKNDFVLLLESIKKKAYSYKDFSMDHAYFFSDFLEALQQLYEFTEESSYLDKKSKYKTFFNQHFYDRQSELTENDVEEVSRNLNKIVQELEDISNQ